VEIQFIAALSHAGVKITSLLVRAKDFGCQFNTSRFAYHNNEKAAFCVKLLFEDRGTSLVRCPMLY